MTNKLEAPLRGYSSLVLRAFSLAFALVFLVSIFPSHIMALDEPDNPIARLGSCRFQQNSDIKKLHFTDDGSCLIAFSSDRTIFWDVASGDRTQVFDHDIAIAFAVSKDGSRIVVSNNSKRLSVIDTRSGKSTWECETASRRFNISISGDGQLIAISEPEAERIGIYEALQRVQKRK